MDINLTVRLVTNNLANTREVVSRNKGIDI